MTTEQTGSDILDIEPIYVRASTGKRFFNYLIDLIVFYLLFFVFGIVMALISPASIDQLTDESHGFGLIDRIVTIIIYAFYMSIVEAIFKGKSLGILITQTR